MLRRILGYPNDADPDCIGARWSGAIVARIAESRQPRLSSAEMAREGCEGEGWGGKGIYDGYARGNHFFAGDETRGSDARDRFIARSRGARVAAAIGARARAHIRCVLACACNNNDKHILQFILLRDLW